MEHHVDSYLVQIMSEASGISFANILRVMYGIHVDADIYRHVVQTASDQGKMLRPFKRQHDRELVVISPGIIMDDYNGGMLPGIRAAAEEFRFDMFVHWQLPPTHFTKYLEALFELGHQGEGFFLMTQDNMNLILDVCAKHQHRCVIGDCDPHDRLGADYPVVGVDNYQSIYQAVNFLLERDYRRIGFIMGISTVVSAQRRLAGYQAALFDAGIPADEDLIVEGNWMIESGRVGTSKLLALDNPPDAIIASNDLMAIGALLEVRQAGLEIPDDLALIGFDDIAMASTVSPQLTTLRQPLWKLGYAAVDMLNEMSNQQTNYLPGRFLETKLVIRVSTPA